jgi:phosphoglycerate dehydrogenase-like enzyme
VADEQLVVSTAPIEPEVIQSALPDGARVIRSDAEGLVAAVPEAVVIVGDWSHKIHVGGDVIAAATRCRLIQQPSAGYENIDVVAAAMAGIPVANAGPANAAAVAEFAVMGALACLRHVREAIADAERGGWSQQRWIDKGLGELAGRTVGILGCGAIGQQVAQRLRGFECHTIYTKRHRLAEADEERLAATFVDLDELLRRSEVLMVTVALNDQTRGLLDAARLAMLPVGAIVVNVGRGAVIDFDALADALRSGALGGAALDVFETEPLPEGHRLAELPNVLLTPHIAGVTRNAARDILMNSIDNVSRVLRGEEPRFVVNRPLGEVAAS